MAVEVLLSHHLAREHTAMISLCGQYIKALCMARGDLSNARAIAEGCGPNWAGTAACLKAAVAAMTGGDTSALISPVASDFAALLRPMSEIGRAHV